MCRWFAYISPSEPCLLEDVLITPRHGLTQQVHEHYLPKLLPHGHDEDSENDMKARNMLFNVDGLGMAWYTSTRDDFQQGAASQYVDSIQTKALMPAMYKTIQPPLNDMNFRSICANTETRVCFAHIRAASGTAITQVNNHPFVFGRHTFMHNGAVSSFMDIKRDVCMKMSQAAYANVLGGTDSEHMAGLYMTYLSRSGDASSFQKEYGLEEMADAMHKMVATIIGLQQKHFGPNKKPNSLNLCATDGIKLVAYRFRNHRTSQPPSLYFSTKAGTTLNRKYLGHPNGPNVPGSDLGISEEQHGDHLIIASEPSTYKASDWELIGKNRYVLAEPNGRFEIKDTPYGEDWNASDA